MMLLLELLVVLSAFLWSVTYPPPAEGLTEVTQMYNCCRGLNVSLIKGCEDRFEVNGIVLAYVSASETQVLDPFRLIADRGLVQVLDCVDFIHRVFCELEDIYAEEKIIHFVPKPCTQVDS